MTDLAVRPHLDVATRLASARDALPKGVLRKVVAYRETLLSEAGVGLTGSIERASVAAVIANPWAGTPAGTDLAEAQARVAPYLAQILSTRLIEILGGVDRIEAFGKGALVGTSGEIEHAGALIHTPYFGNLLRDHLAGESIICFADERGSAGQVLVVPMWHKHRAATRSHYQTVTAHIADAPRVDEIVVVAAASTGSRPHPRIGDRTTDPVVTAEMYEPQPQPTHENQENR